MIGGDHDSTRAYPRGCLGGLPKTGLISIPTYFEANAGGVLRFLNRTALAAEIGRAGQALQETSCGRKDRDMAVQSHLES